MSILAKVKKIRLLILDVDGVLTDGRLMYCSNGTEIKAFNVLDGLGIKLLQSTGVEVAIITSRQSELVTNRMADLDIKYVYQGVQNKLEAYEKLKVELKLTDDQVAYVGDDLPDLPVMRRVGLSMSVQNGSQLVQQIADWIPNNYGGQGAVREICEFIMQGQNRFDTAIQSYMND